MKKQTIFVSALFCALAVRSFGEERVLAKWDFAEAGSEGWTSGANHCRDVRVEDGSLKGVMAGNDPFVASPAFVVEASSWQVVEFEAKTVSGGVGELFWMPEGASVAQQKWSARFEWIGDGQWHTYRVRPYWQGAKRVTRLRLDFTNPQGQPHWFEIRRVSVKELTPTFSDKSAWSGNELKEWEAAAGAEAALKGAEMVFKSADGKGAMASPGLRVDSASGHLLAVEMAVERGDLWKVVGAAPGQTCQLFWATGTAPISEATSARLPLKADGGFHDYVLDVGASRFWRGKINSLRFDPVNQEGVSVTIESVRLLPAE